MNEALSWWQQSGGNAYMQRNEPTPADIDARTLALSRIFERIKPRPRTLLEVGVGPGANLVALNRLLGNSTQLYAVEPNKTAREMAKIVCPNATVMDGHASAIHAADGTFDIVMSAGVLIHIPPDRLELAMKEIIRVSNRYVLCIEYFAPSCEPVQYYGAERIWRNDFGKLYMELGLKPVVHGFFWKPTDGYDNVVFHLLEK